MGPTDMVSIHEHEEALRSCARLRLRVRDLERAVREHQRNVQGPGSTEDFATADDTLRAVLNEQTSCPTCGLPLLDAIPDFGEQDADLWRTRDAVMSDPYHQTGEHAGPPPAPPTPLRPPPAA